jgi:hypothetical protein
VIESELSRADRRRASIWLRLGLAGLLLACAAVLLFHAGHGSRVTRDLVSGPWRQQADAAHDQLGCLADRVEELVPPGSRVHVGPGPGVELQQRIGELVVYADAELVSEPAAADLVLDAGAATGPSCRGVTLGVVPA